MQSPDFVGILGRIGKKSRKVFILAKSMKQDKFNKISHDCPVSSSYHPFLSSLLSQLYPHSLNYETGRKNCLILSKIIAQSRKFGK